MGLTFNLGRLSPSIFTDASNNIGIGAAPSGTYKFEVTGTAKVSTSLLVNDISISSSTMQASGNYYIGCNNANFIQFYTSNTDRMAITAAGNVGIGTTAPNYSLHINTATTITRLQITNTTTGTTNASGLQIIQDGNNTTLSLKPSGFMSFETANTERMRITSGGDVQFTKVGDNLYTKSDGTNYTRIIFSGGNINCFFPGGTTANNGRWGINNYEDNAALLRVYNNGLINTGLQTNSPYNFSLTGRDCYINSSGELGYLSSVRESKTNISSVSDINWITQLNPVSFNYRKKDDEMNYTEEFYDDKSFGFIADEVEKVNPDFVFYDINEDGTKKLAGVKYQSMTAILTKIVQEQQIQIQNLQQQNQDLKSRLDKAGL